MRQILGTGSDSVLELTRRAAVRLAFGGGLILVLFSSIQIVIGETGATVTLVAALLVVAAALVHLRQEHPNVILLLALMVFFAIAAEAVAALQGTTEYVAGVGGEVVVFGLGVLAVFIARDNQRQVAAGFLTAAIVIVVISQVTLNGVTLEIVSDCLTVVAVLGTVMYLEIKVLESLAASQSRFSDLASVIPVATFEFDISRVMARLSTMRGAAGAATSLDELFAEFMPLVRLSYVNRTANAMADDFGAWDAFVAGPNAPRVRSVAWSMLSALIAGKTGDSDEVTWVRRDGSEQDFVFHWSLGRVAGKSAPHRLVLVATDVTRVRQAERELERQLRERDQFVASVSHELRTPLTSIMGLTEELVRRPGDFDAGERAELLEIVSSETRDVVDIVEDLLVAARAEAGGLNVTVVPCDVGAEVERVAEPFGDVATSVGPVWAQADPVRLRQVLRNLVSNAQRYGGDAIRVVVHREPRWAVVEVRDNGDPLPQSDRCRIFEPYERAGSTGAVGSVGLGLHVARVLARLMGGDLSYHHDGHEAIFRLQLPVLDKQLDVGSRGEVEEGGGAGDGAALDQV
jgi:signal transduction histidine kinase